MTAEMMNLFMDALASGLGAVAFAALKWDLGLISTERKDALSERVPFLCNPTLLSVGLGLCVFGVLFSVAQALGVL